MDTKEGPVMPPDEITSTPPDEGPTQTAPEEKFEEKREPLDPETLEYWQSQVIALKAEVENLKRKLYTDKLTGLPNFDCFQDQITSEIADVADPSKKTESLLILFLDLDRFKEANDKYGHPAGDQVLIQFGQRILGELRPTDWAARRSGDEFLVVLGGVKETKIKQAFFSFAKRLTNRMADPFSVEGREITVGVSIGMASVSKGEKKDWQTLEKEADQNMYLDKEAAHAELN